MIRVGFLGRTKFLYKTIELFSQVDGFEISFIWTCKDEDYYDFKFSSFEKIAKRLGVKFYNSSHISEFRHLVEADVVVSVNFINIIPITFINKFIRYNTFSSNS